MDIGYLRLSLGYLIRVFGYLWVISRLCVGYVSIICWLCLGYTSVIRWCFMLFLVFMLKTPFLPIFCRFSCVLGYLSVILGYVGLCGVIL